MVCVVIFPDKVWGGNGGQQGSVSCGDTSCVCGVLLSVLWEEWCIPPLAMYIGLEHQVGTFDETSSGSSASCCIWLIFGSV